MRIHPVLLLLLTGCGAHSTYEDSKHVLAPQRPVEKHQSGWESPSKLEIVRLSTREEVHEVCNIPTESGRGSHYNALGIHWAHIQDRGCYMHAVDKSWGKIYYLEGDLQALKHEKEHHTFGPGHHGPKVSPRYRRLTSMDMPKTGTRITTPYGSADR
jgi:hypothetical protein